jgi:diguanylate cyclase (GGDEF)-like protein
MILATGTTSSKALFVAEKIRAIVNRLDEEGVPKFTVSFGVTEYKAGESVTEFTKRVDEALYQAKNLGRNRVERII